MENDNNLEVLTTIVTALKGLDVEAQTRTLQAVMTFLGISPSIQTPVANINSNSTANSRSNTISFSEDRDISPKEFLKEKMPHTDVERVACLAFYLTHYRNMPFFKTLDISTLNTEAAQPKLSNATYAVDNATKAGLLVQAGKGNKQISAVGEMFVQALPDRDAAKNSLSANRVRRRSKKAPLKKNGNK